MSPRTAIPSVTLSARIRLTMLLVGVLAIAVVTVGAVAIGYHSLHRQVQAQIAALARVTATQAQAPLLFRDRVAAVEVLQALPAQAGITIAELRDERGAIVARVADTRHQLPDLVASALALDPMLEEVIVDGVRVGAVSLESDGKPLLSGLFGLLAYDLLAGMLTASVVLFFARRLTRRVTLPLTELGAVIRGVRRDRDYTRRAPPCGLAEIEELRADFHALLEEIERRDGELSRTNAALARLALCDALTGLPNRAMLERALLEALRGAGGTDRRAGLLYFDIDSFKSVNDTLGHGVGDALLREIAARLHAQLPAGAVAARIGGDEFVVLLAPVDSEDTLRSLAGSLHEALHAPLRIGAHVFHPGLSIGFAISGGGATDPSDLMKLADGAMYRSKHRRRSAGMRTRWEDVAEGASSGKDHGIDEGSQHVTENAF